MADIVEDIKSRLSVEQVVGAYCELKKAGRNFKACCPFHAEKTPSFVVSPEKQLAYCFGCHKGGDMFTFIQEVEGVDFKESIRMLADKAGLNYEDYRTADDDSHGGEKSFASSSQKDRLYEVNEEVCRLFQKKLADESGKEAREYLENRGMSQKSISDFRIGYAPDSFDETYNHLLEKGFSKVELISAGIVVAKDTGNERVYDRFRHRIMFPIFSHSGQVVAFGGRVIRKEDEPKYLNSPDTDLFRKGKILYGFKDARQEIKDKGFVVVVEGYMDVIASHHAGIKNVVASSGTALTDNQGKILKRLTKDFRLCFDSDNAGQMAARRAIDLLQPLNVSLKIVKLDEGKDPDELIKNHPEMWHECLSGAVYYFDYFLKQHMQDGPPKTLDQKKAILSDLLPMLKRVKSSMEQDDYVRKLATFLSTNPDVVYSELKNTKLIEVPMPVESSAPKPKLKRKVEIPVYFLSFLLAYPYFIPNVKENSSEYEKYLTQAQKDIYLQILSHYNNQAHFEELIGSINDLDKNEKQRLALLALYAEEKNSHLSEAAVAQEFKAVCESLKKYHRKHRINALTAGLKEARASGDSETSKKLLQELNSLITS